MIIPRLFPSPINSLQNSMQYESKPNSSSNYLKQSLTCSTLDSSSKLNRSTVSFNNSRLYSSAATHNSSNGGQQQLIDKKHLCIVHFKKFTYTCITCNENTCSQCLSNPGKHRSHRFQRYHQKKEDLRIIREEMLSQINLKRDKINKLVENIQIQTLIKNNQKYKAQKLLAHDKSLQQKMSQNLSEFQNTHKDYKNNIKQLNKFYEQSLQQLTNTTRVVLLNRIANSFENHLSYKIQQLSSLQYKPPINKFNVFLKPNFYSNIFTVCNFTNIRQTTKQKIFQPFQAFQSLWRLKVYPTGYAGVKVDEKLKGIDYMSVYAQRIDGLLQKSNYIIRIQITSRKDPRLMIKKQFKSQFTKNQSWGYDRFTKLSNIYDHGFLGDDDTLFLKIMITPANYYEATCALQENINKKQKIYEQNERKIKILKGMLEKKHKQQKNKISQHFFQNQQKQLIIQTNNTQQSYKKDELKQVLQQRLQTQNKDQCQRQSGLGHKVENPYYTQVQPKKTNYYFSARFKQQITGKIHDRTTGIGLTRNKQIQYCPSISLEKKSPGKLIRLVSLKNTQLIINSMKKIHNRSSTYF